MLFVTQSCDKKKQNNPREKQDLTEINNLIDIGHKHYENEAFDSSFYYFNKAKYAAEIKKDTSRIIHSLGWMALIQKNQEDYSGSEATATQALPLFENTKKYPNGTWTIYNVLGNDYLYTFDYDNALFYYNKAMDLEIDQLYKLGIQNNISLVYMEQKEYRKAIQILYPLTLKKEIQNDSEIFSRILDNLGYCYYKVGDSKALKYLEKSLQIRTKRNDQWGIIPTYSHLSEYYNKSNPILAYEYALLAYKKASDVNAVDDRLECLKSIIQNTSGNELKKYSLAYLHINDSITKVRQKAKNQFAKIKYDSTVEKEENIKLKIQKILQEEEQRTRNLFQYFVFAIVILISILLSNFLIAKNKREKIKATYITEIRISKKLHDELANDVYQTMAFAETQDLAKNENKEILLSNLDCIYSRTRNISRENSTVETGVQFIPNLKEMMSGFNTDRVNVLTNGMDTIHWTKIENDKKIIVYRVIQELLVNMKKHSKCSLVVLTFKRDKNKLQIDYTDNGIGTANNQLNSKNGLLNIENRIQAAKGIIIFDTNPDKGFRVRITFPVES